jgi:hypothetical protein
MKVIFGLMLKVPTALSISSTGVTNGAAILQSARRDGSTGTLNWQALSAAGSWALNLTAGEYIVQLDDSAQGPVEVTLNPAAILVGIEAHEATNGVVTYHIAAWSETTARASDPKNPFPPPPSARIAADELGSAQAAWFNTVLGQHATELTKGHASW